MNSHMPILALCLIVQVPPPAAQPDPAKVKELRREHDSILQGESAKLAKVVENLEKDGKASLAGEVRGLIALEPAKDGPRRFVPLPEIVPPAKDDKALAGKPAEPTEVKDIRSATAKSLLDLARCAGKRGAWPWRTLACAKSSIAIPIKPRREDCSATFRSTAAGRRVTQCANSKTAGLCMQSTVGLTRVGFRISNATNCPESAATARSALDSRRRGGLFAARFLASLDDQHRTFSDSDQRDARRGDRFARRVEDFHQLFLALFADVIGPGHPLAARFEGKEPKVSKPQPHLIDYFSSRTGFVAYLRGMNIDPKDSLGYYIPPESSNKRMPSYFYKDEGGEISSFETLYHESSHQLLFENAGPALFEHNLGNYWPFEGLGTYFETVRPQTDGALLIGGRTGRRFDVARTRILGRKEYTQLDRFVAMSKKTFLSPPEGDVYLDYGQAMALTIFLLESDRGRYRDEFLDYVRDVYKGRV